ncbi:cohesin domain-containing protein [Zongyangia hominis]|uniref:Cohesin domain-containing protein n=1 Tax=Zongyangia hominis TaxID=2763677 RepID=A0A926EE45_9FIRM|nr:cohesin domain-containing protein [Zongyangia hominis]MBC8571403.1 hypothetical protein [Zongyangia hominis]
MKKILSSLLVCCILAAVLACQVFAASPAVKLTPGVAEAKPGDTIVVTVSTETADDLYGFQMDVTYDPAVLEYKSAQPQTPASWYAESADMGEGNIRLLAYDDTADLSAPVQNAAGLFLITFQVKSDAAEGDTGMGIKDLLVAGVNGDLVPGAAGAGTTVNIKGEGGGSSSSEPPVTSEEPPVTSSTKPTTTKKPHIPGGNGGGSVTIPTDTGKKPNPGTNDTALLIGSLVVLAGAGGTAVFLASKKRKK